MALTIVETLSLVIEEAANSTRPNGGVARPTVKLRHMTMAKWVGLIPNCAREGPRMGPRIKMAGPASRNMPIMNNRIFAINKNKYGLSVTPRI